VHLLALRIFNQSQRKEETLRMLFLCVLHVCIGINYAVLYSCSGDLSAYTCTACGSTEQPALLNHPLHLLGHFKMRPVIENDQHIHNTQSKRQAYRQ
jgi:hypothetical protein